MNTILFEETALCRRGFAEYGERHGGLYIKYSIEFKENITDIFKLTALSSKKPFAVPIVADTAVVENLCAASQREISHATLVRHGYTADDIDTFVLIKKCADGSWGDAATRCFGGIVWDAEGAFKADLTAISHSPTEKGKEILKSIKELTKCRSPETAQKWREKVSAAVNGMERCKNAPVMGYEWYTSYDIRPPVPLSAYRHLLYVTQVITCFDRDGFYLFGTADGGHTALAVRSDGSNPFVNADDCAVKNGSWWTVGVYLGDDGQYFEKAELKD